MYLTFKKIILSFLLFFFVLNAFTQKVDTLLVKKHSPKKATIMSAVLPGAGQIYNRKYWKLPIIYAGFGTLGYFIIANNNLYKEYKLAYKYKMDNDSTTIDKYPLYSAEGLLQAKNYYRRNFEISCIFTGILYMLNVVDATVDAHLFDFDISNNLSLKIQPALFNNRNFASNDFTKGIKITLNLKN